MELFDRLLITTLALLFLIVGCLMYIDKRQRIMDSRRISFKIQHAQRLLDDVLGVSNDLRIRESLEKIPFGDCFIEGDESSKSVILEAIDVKEDVINECLNEAKQCLDSALTELKST